MYSFVFLLTTWWRPARSRGLGTDKQHLNVPFLHLSGHLTPGAEWAEGGEHAVPTDGVLQGTITQVIILKLYDYMN